jgi:prepilin peptidase CpaA
VAAVTDVVEFRVRNLLTLPLIVSGLVYHAATGGSAGFTTSLAGFAFGIGVLIVPWLLGLMGAGDAKLLAGVGAWLGLPGAIATFIAASAITFVYASILIIYRGKIRESLMLMKVIGYRFLALGTYFGKDDLVEQCFAGPDRRQRVIPFGAMVPLGILGALLWFVWIKGVS